MSLYHGLRQFVLGAPLDPMSSKTRHSIVLAAFFAWVGLGADGISSSAYGPEEAFRALELPGLQVLGTQRVAQQRAVARRAAQLLQVRDQGGGHLS